MAKKTAKKRNPQDATHRNTRAAKHRVDEFERRVGKQLDEMRDNIEAIRQDVTKRTFHNGDLETMIDKRLALLAQDAKDK